MELRLPEDLAAEVDARTSDGSIRSSHPHLTVPEPDGEDRGEDRRSLKATLGAGGHALRVRTGDGSIREYTVGEVSAFFSNIDLKSATLVPDKGAGASGNNVQFEIGLNANYAI